MSDDPDEYLAEEAERRAAFLEGQHAQAFFRQVTSQVRVRQLLEAGVVTALDRLQ